MKNRQLILIFVILLFFASGSAFPFGINKNSKFNTDVIIKSNQNDSLVIGKFYAFGTKQKRQYIGELVGIDSVCYNIKTEEGLFKIIKTDVIVYEERTPFKVSDTYAAEDTSVAVIIILSDENEITGYVIQQDTEKIIFRKTANDSILNIPRNTISEIKEPKTEIFNGKKYIADPNDARLFLAPTARPIRKNVLLISDVEVFFPMVGFGIENIGSIVGGFSYFPNSKDQIIYVNAKVTPYRFKYGDVAAGIVYFDFFEQHSDKLLIGYTGATVGTPFASFTGGLGFGIGENHLRTALIILGGEIRVSEGSKIITENWIYTNSYIYPMSFIGLRIFGSYIAVDIAALKFWGKKSSEWKIEMIPYASLTLNFDLFK